MLDIYRNKKVLVTGHTGFKGSWLSIWLHKLGAEVIGYALAPKNEKDNFVLAKLESKILDYRSDIREFKKLKSLIDTEKPEIIFHLAAQPLVLESYNNPLFTIETNTVGTANILEAFRCSKDAKVLIVITTDKVYKNNEWIWGYREIDRLGGLDLYSASKAAAELLVESYQKSFIDKDEEKVIVSVRAGNVIGGGDWAENRIVPDCIKALESDKKIIVRNPSATRPWQHVLEPLGGYLLLGSLLVEKNRSLKGAWNFGPNSENNQNVETLVKILIERYGKGEYEILKSSKGHHEANLLSLDITKAKRELNWQPLLTFQETMKYTIDWYKNYKTNDVFDLCINQITDYEKLWKLKN